MSYPIGRFCVAGVALWLAHAHSAQALQLDWQAPASCPTGDAVRRDIQRLAGANQGDALEARAIVTQTNDQRWRVVIDLSGAATGHRALTADSCAQLARATALIVGLAANPDAALDLPDDEPARPSQADSPVTPATKSPTVGVERTLHEEPKLTLLMPKPRARMALELLARAGIERGSLPTSTGWIGAGAGLRATSVPIRLAVTAHVTQSTSATFTNGIGAHFQVVAAQARLCVDSVLERWRVAGCGGMQLALLRANGFVDNTVVSHDYVEAMTFTRYRWIPAPLFGLELSYALVPSLAAELGIDVVIPTRNWQFVVENLAPLFRPAALQSSFYVGLGYRVP